MESKKVKKRCRLQHFYNKMVRKIGKESVTGKHAAE